MYRHNEKQLKFVEFHLPFGGKLSASNRWVRLAQMIPWDKFEESYCGNLSKSGHGPPALSVRIVLAALIIKEYLGLTDEECVEQIRDNPYLQYFCGLKEFTIEPPFHPTMLVHFRKRFPADALSMINEVIVAKAAESRTKDNNDDEDEPGEPKASNKGKLLLDATCVPADITYPTDLKLLNTAREISVLKRRSTHNQRGEIK